jgi:large subunit ribosomal protein L3
MMGLLGRKLGMTHVYDPQGRRLAVTAVQAGPCTVLGVNPVSARSHGVNQPQNGRVRSVQLGFEPIKASKLTKPVAGQFQRVEGGPFRYVREFRETNGAEWAVGRQLTVEMFKAYELVDVTGTSIGKGFQGGVKRWGWKGGPQTHGSMSHRAPGSIGSTTTPGRVFRGHHLPGHMGAARVTVQNLRVVACDPEHHLLLIEGAVPGARKGLVMIRKSVKRPGVIRAPQAIQTVVEEEGPVSKGAKAVAKAKK